MVPDASDPQPRRTRRTAGVLGSAWAAFMGALPHVLHHVGPLAGAAIVAGTTGTLLFGVAAFLLTIPLLLRVRRHCGSWRNPAILLATFVAIWTLSTWVVGPWINEQLSDNPAPARQQGDEGKDKDHEEHHDEGAGS